MSRVGTNDEGRGNTHRLLLLLLLLFWLKIIFPSKNHVLFNLGGKGGGGVSPSLFSTSYNSAIASEAATAITNYNSIVYYYYPTRVPFVDEGSPNKYALLPLGNHEQSLSFAIVCPDRKQRMLRCASLFSASCSNCTFRSCML